MHDAVVKKALVFEGLTVALKDHALLCHMAELVVRREE